MNKLLNIFIGIIIAGIFLGAFIQANPKVEKALVEVTSIFTPDSKKVLSVGTINKEYKKVGGIGGVTDSIQSK